MANIADFTVYDGEATPVAHVLKAIEAARENGANVALWRENLAGVPEEGQVRMLSSLKKLKSGVFVPSLRLIFPKMEQASGQNSSGYTAPPKVAYEDTIVVTGYFNPRSTTQGRLNVSWAMSNILRGVASTTTPTEGAGDAGRLFHWLIPPA